MMNLTVLVKLAWRNLWRNKRRTVLLLLALGFGACSLILVGGFLDDLMVHMREDFIHTQNGHIQISRPGYAGEGTSSPLDYSISGFSALRKELEQVEHVRHVIPRVRLLGVANGGESSVAVQLIGVDPVAEASLGGYRHTPRSNQSFQIVEGRNLRAGDDNFAVAGQSLRKSLSLKVGGEIKFLTMRKEGALDGEGYGLAGTFLTFMKAFDERTMMVPLSAAQRMLGSSDTVTYVLLLLDKTENTARVVDDLRRILKAHGQSFEVLGWYDQAEYYFQCRVFLDTIFRTITALFGAIFAFTLYNMISFAIRERTREFGTMLALGNDRNLVFTSILLEALFLGAAGAVVGALLGVGLGFLISQIGIPMPPPPQGTAPYEAVISLSPGLLLHTMGWTVLSCVLGALIPAYKCSRAQVVVALGFA